MNEFYMPEVKKRSSVKEYLQRTYPDSYIPEYAVPLARLQLGERYRMITTIKKLVEM